MKHYSRNRQPKPQPPDGYAPPEPDNLPPPGTEIGHITLSLYGQSVHVPIRQPGTVKGRRPRSDQIAVEVDGAWLVMSLREAALDAVKRMPRVMTRKERAGW